MKTEKNKPSKKDDLILDYYYRNRLNINEKDGDTKLKDDALKSKRDIWSLNKMENLVRNDETLTNEYNRMAVDGPFKFGYHWNEVIMNILFNEYVLADNKYMTKYKNTIEVPKKRRGNPDGKIDDSDFVDYDKRTKHKKSYKKKEDKMKDNKKVVKKKPKKVETKEKNIEETTTTGSAGGAAGYVGYLTPHAFAKNPESSRFSKKVPYMPDGSVIVESENYLTNSSLFESIVMELEEEKRHSAMILKDRLSKENEKNFYNDLKVNKEISDAVKDAVKKDKEDKIKSSQDIEKEQMKDEFKPVKFDQKEDFDSEYDDIPKGMEDLDYDIEPSEKYKERVKNEMGEDIYDKGRERIEKRKNQSLYNKDTQPTETESKYKEKFDESYMVSGKYINKLNKSTFVNFRLNESTQVEDITNNLVIIRMDGIGNTYTNKVELNESVTDIMDNYEFYYDLDTGNIYHCIKNSNLNEGLDLSKFKHLSGYDSKKYLSKGKNIKYKF